MFWNIKSQLLQNIFQILWIWGQIGSLKTAGTHQNGNFPQKYFKKSARGGECSKEICLHQGCLTSYSSTLPGNPTLSVRGQTPNNRFGAINSFMYLTPFCLILQTLEKLIHDQTEKIVSNLVLLSTRNVYSSSIATSEEQKLKKPKRGSPSSNWKKNITTSSVDHIMKRSLKKGVSETAAQSITSTRRKSSGSDYNLFWRMWASWCDKQQADAFRYDVIKIFILLSYLRKVMNTGPLNTTGQPFLPSMIM